MPDSTASSSPPRTSGFRLSISDALVLLIAAAGAWWLHRAGHELWWIVAAVVGHFFLFCNVFRVRRSLELCWAAAFIINMGWWMAQDRIGWLPAMAWQAPISLAVIGIEILSPSYHGIGSRWINRRRDPSGK
jgi:hypothetical protein